jgi:cytochrome P450
MINTYREQYPFHNYFALTHNPIGFLSDVVRKCGDFARINILTFRFYLVNDPDLIREALVEKSEALIIEGGVSGGLARLIGHGILTNNGDRWRESRRTLQPLFRHDALDTYSSITSVRVQESLDRWKSRFSGRSFPINRELLCLSLRITCSTLFGYLPTFEEAEEFADAIWVLQSDGMRRYMTGRDFMDRIPVPMNRRVKCATTTLNGLAQKTIEGGAGLPRDEILSILFAGTESPSNTLCWALKLLEDHPAWRDTLADSISRDNDRSDVLSQVISEAVRLYPAGWAFERRAAQDTTLGDEAIRKGSRLLFSPFLLHRNPRFWREPETFDPARFMNGRTIPDGVPKYAYLPFGAGPRSCIGSRMAWLEMRIILGMLVDQCRWTMQTLSNESPLVPQGSFKIRLNHPLFVRMDFGPS